MKAKVLIKFIDKYTGEIRKVDDIIEVTEERYNEILVKGKLVEEIAEEKEEKPKKATKKSTK